MLGGLDGQYYVAHLHLPRTFFLVPILGWVVMRDMQLSSLHCLMMFWYIALPQIF